MQIVKDEKQLRKSSGEITVKACLRGNVFGRIEKAMNASDLKGIGLVAAQIGWTIQAGIIRIPQVKTKHIETQREFSLDYINPKILSYGEVIIVRKEGCLSFPETRVDTLRAKSIRVSYIDVNKRRWLFWRGKRVTVTLEGLPALVMQHGVDNMNGVLFFDKKMAPVSSGKKISRNQKCPCGSNVKYKKCCEVK